MSKTRLLSPFCVLSCYQSSSLFSGLLCRFRDSPVERFFYKFDGIDCCPKLGPKLLDRFFHRRRQISPPVSNATHRFFDGSQHFLLSTAGPSYFRTPCTAAIVSILIAARSAGLARQYLHREGI